jgi:RNA polymerase sigma-70 factor, ECF subfamily
MKAPDSGGHSRSISSTMLAGVKLRQPEAWSRLVDVWAPVIYGWCRRRDVQAADAADIVQEVLIQVCRKVPDFERESFTRWISTITRHKIDDHFRAGNRRPKAVGGSSANQFIHDQPDPDGDNPDDGCDGPSAASLNSLVVRRVLNVIRGDFEERTFRAFWRMTIDSLPAAEVAAELGMTDAAVSQAKHRVMKRLREESQAMGIRVMPRRSI